MRAINLIGQQLGRLTAVEPTEKREGSNIIWRCLCDCGNEVFVSTGNLRSGHTKSCGCFARELAIIHGMCGTSIYKKWQQMIQRCENPNQISYKYYGGRGIKVCDHWHSFENFYADVGDPPEGKTLDRWPDNDGDYDPNNWRWGTLSEQQQNKRSMSCGFNAQRWFFAYNEKTGKWFESNNQSEFAKEHGLSRGKIGECLHKKYKTHKNWTFDFLT